MSSFVRPKSVSKRILILCEGWTEYNYASALKQSLNRDKQRGIEINIYSPTNENNIEHLFKRALKFINEAKKENNPYDIVWIFFDNDNQNILKNLTNLLKKKKRNINEIKKCFTFDSNSNTYNKKDDLSIIKFAYSCICIEHWFIIHLKDIRTPFKDAIEAKRKLENLWKKTFNEEYKKNGQNHFDKLKKKQANAIKIAQSIRKAAEKDEKPIHEINPYFTVDKLIEFFYKL